MSEQQMASPAHALRLSAKHVAEALDVVPNARAIEGGDGRDTRWSVFGDVVGPPDCAYAGMVFEACAQLPPDFPFRSPSVAFTRPAPFHPNVAPDTGAVCVDALNEAWTASTRLASVFTVLLPALLAAPNPDSPLDAAAAAAMQGGTLAAAARAAYVPPPPAAAE